MGKQLLAAVVIAVAISSSIGFAFGQASNPQPADAASGNGPIVSQLKKINTSVKSVDSGLGASSYPNSVVGQLYKANLALEALENYIGTSSYSGDSVRALLRKICGNVNTASPSGICY
jgi:hypothetical protein